jgi:lipid A 3-O-deacylase
MTHMNRFLISLAAAVVVSTASASAQAPSALNASVDPWSRHALDIELGMLWKVGGDTPLNYRIAPSMISWRTPYIFGKVFRNGAALVARNRLSMMANWFETGAENRYLGWAGGPSIELWSPCKCWAAFFSIGGGFGLTDSQGVLGGQGQDFTFNWFSQLGVEHRLNETFSVRLSGYFQHLSNRGATDPNPGLNSLGVLVGGAWTF